MLCTWRYNGGGQTVMYENNARHEEGWEGKGVRAFEFHKLGEGWDGTRGRGGGLERADFEISASSSPDDLLILGGFQPRDHVLFAMRFRASVRKTIYFIAERG